MHISEFQEYIKEHFYKTDSERGLYRTALWFMEEVGEVAREIKKPIEQIDKEHVAEELSDVIAWAVSIANLLGISIEDAIKKKYP